MALSWEIKIPCLIKDQLNLQADEGILDIIVWAAVSLITSSISRLELCNII